MSIRCGAICLIALFVALSDQESNKERGASKQLAAPLPYTHLLSDLTQGANFKCGRFVAPKNAKLSRFALEQVAFRRPDSPQEERNILAA
jgi:hypothetical protein